MAVNSARGAIMVTGAGGFIGQALVRQLAQDAVPAVLLCRDRVPAAGVSRVYQVADLATATLEPYWFEGVRAVVHLAGLAHAPGAPAAALHRANVVATHRLAATAAACGVERFVLVSSAKVLGENSAPDQVFTAADPAAPPDAYAESKWRAELAVQDVSAASGLATVIIRPPLVYGPGAVANFAALIRLVRLGLPLPLASVDNRRSLVAVDNLASLLSVAANHPAAVGRTWLVSDGEDVSAPGLLRLLATALACRLRLFPFPPALLQALAIALGRRGAWQKLCGSFRVDGDSIRRELGWMPALTTAQAFARYAGSW